MTWKDYRFATALTAGDEVSSVSCYALKTLPFSHSPNCLFNAFAPMSVRNWTP